MAVVKSSRFGPVEYEVADLIHFEEGLLGFTDKKKFLLLDHAKKENEQKEPGQNQLTEDFKWLQSVDDPDLAFVVVDPALFRDDYKISLSAEETARLGENYNLWAIVTIPQDPLQITANLKGPLAVSREMGAGKQLVLDSKEFSTRHYVIAEMQYRELQKLKAKHPAQGEQPAGQQAVQKAVSE